MAAQLSIRNRWLRWASVALFWTLIALFYSTGVGRNPDATFEARLIRAMSQWYVWGLLAPFIIAVDRRLPVSWDAILQRALLHVPLSFLFTSIYIYASAFARALLSGTPGEFSPTLTTLATSWGGAFHWNLLIYWLIVGGYFAYGYYNEVKERQLKNSELERLLAQSRLETLRAQLNPHFLFNALNAISAHVERDPRMARRMLEQLGDLLRLSLAHTEDQEIRLEQELAFLERYLAIQKVRFEDQLDVSMQISPDVLPCMVPTFVLQPFVENAIRHGISPRSAKGIVKIAAWRANGRLHLRVEDDGPGMSKDWEAAGNRGVGIANTRERLRRLYGESGYGFDITTEPGAGVRIDLRLPFRDSEGQ